MEVRSSGLDSSALQRRTACMHACMHVSRVHYYMFHTQSDLLRHQSCTKYSRNTHQDRFNSSTILNAWCKVGGPGVLCLIELASLTRCTGQGAGSYERAIIATPSVFKEKAIAAKLVYNRGLLTVAKALHARVKGTWTRTS